MTNAYRLFFLVCSLALLLCGCGSSHRERLQQLETLEAFNIADSVMTNDSLAQVLCDYFDEHGTPNERMRAHYILGRTYADLGEAPAALEAYLDAAAAADTTAADCDWAKLNRIHIQSARLYYMLLQPRSQLDELSKAQLYALKAKDTLIAIECYAQKADAYRLLHQLDSVVLIREKASHMYQSAGNNQRAAAVLGAAITSALEINDISRVREFMMKYEKESGLYDSSGRIQKGRETYYYAKGRFYLAINRLDSAEFLFRRLQEDGYTLNHQIASCKGLQEVYERLQRPDSIAKYANLGYILNDSAYSLAEMENIQRLKASYDYNRNKNLAEKKAKEAHAANLRFIIAFAFLMILIVASVYFMRRNKKRKMVQSAKYRAAIIERNKLRKEIESLTAKDYDTIIARKEREIAELNKTIEQQGTMHRQVMANDKLSVFEKSAIVQVFKDKRTYHKGQEAVSNDEWKALVSQFRSDMPSASSSMSSLSPLQLHVCILLLLGFEEGEIALVCQTRPQVITNAKARANQKLFLLNDSASLKGNLTNLIAS